MTDNPSPEIITELGPGQVFVFGSNLAGRHGAGAALQARLHFGAELGIGEGLTGQCYAFPTLTASLDKRPYPALVQARNRLYATARALPEKTFLLTKVGCGLAGYSEVSMRGLFSGDCPPNIRKPEAW